MTTADDVNSLRAAVAYAEAELKGLKEMLQEALERAYAEGIRDLGDARIVARKPSRSIDVTGWIDADPDGYDAWAEWETARHVPKATVSNVSAWLDEVRPGEDGEMYLSNITDETDDDTTITIRTKRGSA